MTADATRCALPFPADQIPHASVLASSGAARLFVALETRVEYAALDARGLAREDGPGRRYVDQKTDKTLTERGH
ncbi:hypothetical protein [Natrinema soli]|uniref:Uncharacterized protein n=1 Tax=Natrinema soli TaxID=1930624 RepID=A0ABD5T0T6_9EURY|nr:hypothetical protein [Natrinema soli]